MDNEPVVLVKEGRVAIITIQNPPVNVLTNSVRDGLKTCVEQVGKDPEVAAVIITGSGEKAFMAGADIKGFPDMFGVPGEAYGYARTIYEVWDKIRDLPKPTIAAINGSALGAGMELALVCDLRVAEEQSMFRFPEIGLGLFPGGGGTQRMPKVTDMTLAKEMMFTGEQIDAETALARGFLNAVTPKGEALAKAKEMAAKISTHSIPILALTKKAINAGLDGDERKGISVEAELWQECFMTQDIQEGVTAFLEKRTPKFKDR